MRRWLFSLLLGCLLVSQQGVLLHGLGHSFAALHAAHAVAGTGHAAADTALSGAPGLDHPFETFQTRGNGEPQPAAGDLCDACLAFSSLATAVASSLAPPTLLAGLRHALAAAEPLSSFTAALPTPRSRGPPAAA